MLFNALNLFHLTHVSQKLRDWFGNHTRNTVKGTDARHSLDLSGRSNRRPLRLQKAQVYSTLYYKEGSPLFLEIKDSYRLYTSGDPTTLFHYRHLFESGLNPQKPSTPMEQAPSTTGEALPATEESTGTDGESVQPSPTPKAVPFVHFQQTLIREKLLMMTSIEAATVNEYIEEQYTAAIKAWERPWMKTPKTSRLPEELVVIANKSGMSEEDLEMQYYQQYTPQPLMRTPTHILQEHQPA